MSKKELEMRVEKLEQGLKRIIPLVKRISTLEFYLNKVIPTTCIRFYGCENCGFEWSISLTELELRLEDSFESEDKKMCPICKTFKTQKTGVDFLLNKPKRSKGLAERA